MLPKYDTVRVKLDDYSYNIVIGEDLLHFTGKILDKHLNRRRVAIVTDDNVAKLHLPKLKKSLDLCQIDYCCLSIQHGEASKSWTTLEKTVEWLLDNRVERDDLILAFGGGVLGDLVGFAASILRRGVSLIQIPTTLLAQVDSSVGGKTGINSKSGKNLVGTFYQPKLVVIDTSVLKSLNIRDFLSGYSEIVKYGLLGDKSFFDWLNKNGKQLIGGKQAILRESVKKSCSAKAKIVSSDEKEKGQRALLNLGHTFGHALEVATGFSDRLIHGEAVSIGCVMAFEFSRDMGFCTDSDLNQVVAHFKKMGLKVDVKEVPVKLPKTDDFISLMLNDKKVKEGVMNLILVRGIGFAFVQEQTDLSKLRTFLLKKFG